MTRRSPLRFRAAIPVVLVTVIASVGLGRAAGPSVMAIADECRARGGDERVCKSVEAFGSSVAHVCRFAGAPDEGCATFKGKVISSSLVTAYESSWVHRAFTLQRRLGERLPLGEELFPSTHNSFNSAAYPPTLSGLDANQQYSMTDQLRMDMRGLEVDVHWFPSVTGLPADDFRAPLMCHATGPHVGCTIERHLREGLEELRAWLDANPGEVLILYVEDHLDDEAGHARGAAVVEETLGSGSDRDLIYRPAGACEDGLPLDVSAADIIGGGKQLVIASACGAGPVWRGLVHSQDHFWVEDGPADFDAAPPCGFGPADYEQKWTRYFEDSTWLTTMVSGSSSPLTPIHAAAMVRCGVNMPSFDQLSPEDGRLAAMVWSWATDEPASDAVGRCAVHRGDGRFAGAGCGEEYPFACVAADGVWTVTGPSGSWSSGTVSCPAGAVFGVPRNAPQTARLEAAKAAAGVANVWLNYAADGAGWVAG